MNIMAQKNCQTPSILNLDASEIILQDWISIYHNAQYGRIIHIDMQNQNIGRCIKLYIHLISDPPKYVPYHPIWQGKTTHTTRIDNDHF